MFTVTNRRQEKCKRVENKKKSAADMKTKKETEDYSPALGAVIEQMLRIWNT